MLCPHTFHSLIWNSIEGAFDLAEPHLLTAGKRDSAHILAQMFTVWYEQGGPSGTFALRGTLP